MQPDPSLYVAGASAALVELVESGKINDPTAALWLRRIAETLSQFALRRDHVPALVEALEARQSALLEDIEAEIKHAGLEPVVVPPRAAAAGEQRIQTFDDLGWAISLNLRKLADVSPTASARGSALHGLFARARGLERDMRAAYRAAQAKMKANLAELRSAPPPPLPTELALERYISQATGCTPVKVRNVRQLIGINTKDIIFFDVEGVRGWPSSVVMRKLRDFNANPLMSMEYEFGLLKELLAGGVPVPRPLAVDPTGNALGHPFIIMERLRGSAMLPGTGRHTFDGCGRTVGEQIARHLAAIHAIDPAKVTRDEQKGLAPAEALQRHFGRYYRIWRDKQVEPSATLENGFVWVMENLAKLDDAIVLVHGDLDFRNILFDGADVSAVLDWERSHLGHPAEDLAYVRGDIEQIMDWNEFLQMYKAFGGRPISDHALRVFHVWGYVFRASCATALAVDGYAKGEHRDYLLATTAFIEGEAWSDSVRDLLEAT